MGRVHSTTLVGDAEAHALLGSITIDSSESMEVTEANLQLLFSPVDSPPFHAFLFFLIRILKFGSFASELLQALNLCLHFTPHFVSDLHPPHGPQDACVIFQLVGEKHIATRIEICVRNFYSPPTFIRHCVRRVWANSLWVPTENVT